MNKTPVISIVLHAHSPFFHHPEKLSPSEERWFFESLSETYLPLLEVFDRLDADHIPFRMALSLSPTLCHMLGDEQLMDRYLDYTDRRIEFGLREIKRTGRNKKAQKIARFLYDKMVDKRVLFTERYEKKLLGVFDLYQKKGRLELMTTAATHAFLPFYTGSPQGIQAQFEVAVASHRSCFGRYPQGFWLPELGWSSELDPWLRSYNFAYTITDPCALVLGEPPAKWGTFFPVRTPAGVFVLGRDFYSGAALAEMRREPAYRDNRRDIGYELPPEKVKPFLGAGGIRTPTGYRYWKTGDGRKSFYDPAAAQAAVRKQVRAFLEAGISRLWAAEKMMNASGGCPSDERRALALCAWSADDLGCFWHEGPQFLENLFREGLRREDVRFMTPGEYLFKQDASLIQTMVPEFSSGGNNGYAETWLDASNDWMYRHVMRALDRMVELAERFPDNTGLEERTLNQAAREILLVQSSDWSKMLYRQESAEYARNQIEMNLRNFTTIYEALGSNYISTEWLTTLEQRHNIFPHINYRIFRRKK
jgi:1,4-alpha-glucan branching enzyme